MGDKRKGHDFKSWTKEKKRCFVTNRKCLKCEKQLRQKYPGICENCKRTVDYKDDH